MKTFIDNLVQLVAIAHPAGGWFQTTATKKANNHQTVPAVIPSPDCFAVRGGSAKKTSTRRTPAP